MVCKFVKRTYALLPFNCCCTVQRILQKGCFTSKLKRAIVIYRLSCNPLSSCHISPAPTTSHPFLLKTRFLLHRKARPIDWCKSELARSVIKDVQYDLTCAQTDPVLIVSVDVSLIFNATVTRQGSNLASHQISSSAV